MNKEECFYYGYVAKAIGLKGELACKLDVSDPNNYKKLKAVLVEIDNNLVEYQVSKVTVFGKKTSLFLNQIDSMDKANQLVGTSLYLPLTQLPVLKGNKFYFHEVIGFKVIDSIHGEIGVIEKVLEYPQQAILQLNDGKHEILIPVRDEFIKLVDRTNKTIEVQTPDGLIEVYTTKDSTSKRQD